MTITEKDARAIIHEAYKTFGEPGVKISLQGAHKIANMLYVHAGWSVTTLFVEEVWNEFAEADKT